MEYIYKVRDFFPIKLVNPNNMEKAKKFGIEGIVFKNANQLEGELLKRNLL